MVLSALALTSAANVIAALGLDEATTDVAVLEDDIDALSALYEQLLGRILASRVCTDVLLDGSGKYTMWLKAEGKWAYPVTALASLTLQSDDGTVANVITVTPSANQVRLDGVLGRLTLLSSSSPVLFPVFPLGRNNILTTFTAGYSLTAHPAQRRTLARAVTLGIQWLRQTSEEGMNVASIRSGDTSVSYHAPATAMAGTVSSLSQLPTSIQAILIPFMPKRL